MFLRCPNGSLRISLKFLEDLLEISYGLLGAKIPEDFLEPPLKISEGFPKGPLQLSGRFLREFLQMSYGLSMATLNDFL